MKKTLIKILDFFTKGEFSKALNFAKKLAESQKTWYDINAPHGKKLGYPDCCIKEFCMQSPEVLEVTNRTKSDMDRYNAACINGEFTGFIPCKKHAKQILAGKITLQSLVKNRDNSFSEFPKQW